MNVPRHQEGEVARAAPSSFDDDFSQPAMFFASLSEIEKAPRSRRTPSSSARSTSRIKERTLGVLVKIDKELAEKVAAGLGLPAPSGKPVEHRPPSPALAQINGESLPIVGRQVGLVAGPDADLSGIAALRTAPEGEGAQVKVIAPVGGTLGKRKHTAGRRADQPHRPVDRVRRGRRRRRCPEGRRPQVHRPAA